MSELKFKEFFNVEKPVEAHPKTKFSDTPLDRLPLAMSYVPMQSFGEVYDEHEALKRGTLFPELDKPFYGKFTGGKHL